MKREDNRHRRHVVAIAAVAVIALCLILPLFLAVDRTEILLRGSSVHAASQGSFALSQPLMLLTEPPVVITSGTLALAKPKGSAALTSRQQADLIASGAGIIVLKDAELQVGGTSDVPAVVGPQAPIAEAVAGHKFRALLVESSTVTLGRNAGSAMRLSDVNVRLKPVPGERLTLQGDFQFLGRQLRLDTTMGLAASDIAAGQIPIRGSVSSASLLKSTFSGRLVLGHAGRLTANSSYIDIQDVPVFARWLGLAWPSQLGLKTLHAEGRLEWDGNVLNFPDGRFRLDQNAAKGSLLINGRGERPLIDGTLAFEQFDAGSLVKSDPQSAADLIAATVQTTADWLPPGVRRLLTDLRLPILRQIDLDLRASAENTLIGGLSLGHTAAAISLHDGQVLVDLPEIALPSGGGGSIQFTLDTKRTVARCGIRSDLKGVRIEHLSNLVFPHQLVSGPADVTLDLSGDWDTPESFVKSVDGRVDVAMLNGAVLAADLRNLLKSQEREPKVGWGKVRSGNTDLSRVAASVTFDQGVARINELRALHDGNQELLVTGSLDVSRQMLSLNLFPRDSATGDKSGISVLSINGNWDRPHLLHQSFPNRAETPPYQSTPVKIQSGSAATRG